MGNLFCCCLGVGARRPTSNVPTETAPPLQPHPPKIPVNRSVSSPYLFTSSNGPYPHQYPSPPLPYVVDEKAVVFRNDTNLKKKTLTLEPDPVNPGHLLVAFTFDALVSGRITIVFFVKEVPEFHLKATKEDTLPPITFDFEKGLGQKFIQPSGTGVDLSVFEDSDLFKEAETDIFPLAIKMEAAQEERSKQITQVTYVMEEGEIKPGVIKQLLSFNGISYELGDIYGTGDTVDEDASDSGKECVICLSEPRDTVVLPCRHMEPRFQTNLCPVCRQPAEKLLKIQLKG